MSQHLSKHLSKIVTTDSTIPVGQDVMTSFSTSSFDACFQHETYFTKQNSNHKITDLTISPFGKFWLKLTNNPCTQAP